MSLKKILLSVSVVALATVAHAGVRNWDEILAKATPQEKQDLGKILQQIRMIPVKDPATGKTVYKVVKVEKDSVFEREGIKAGDLIDPGSWGTAGDNMKMKTKMSKDKGTSNQ